MANRDVYNQALAALKVAVDTNDEAAAKKWLQVARSYEPVERETPPVGARALRGIESAWEGVRQLGTEVGEAAGVLEPGSAEKYTREQQSEREAFREMTRPSVVGDLEEIAGEAVPFALTRRPGPTISAAALEGASRFMPDPSPSSRVLGAGIGGVLGKLGSVGEEATLGMRIDPSQMTPQAQRATQYAADEGLRMRPVDVVSTGRVKSISNAARQGRYAEDLLPLANEARQHAEDVASRYVRDKNPNLLASYDRTLNDLRQAENVLYEKAYETVGDAPLDLGRVTNKMDEIMTRYEMGGGDWRALRKVVDHLTTDGLPARNNVRGWREFRTRLREQQRLFESDRINAQPLEDMYWSITDEIMDAARRANPKGAQLLKEANDFTFRQVVPIENLRLDKMDDTQIVRKLRSMTPEKAADVVSGLDADGKTDLMRRLHQRATENSIDKGFRTGFSPAAYAASLEKDMHIIDALGDSSATRGLMDYLRTVQNLTAETANPQTGISLQNASMWNTLQSYNPLPALMSRSSEFRALASQLGRQGPGSKAPFRRNREEIIEAMTSLLMNTARSASVQQGMDFLNEKMYQPQSLPTAVMPPHPSESY